MSSPGFESSFDSSFGSAFESRMLSVKVAVIEAKKIRQVGDWKLRPSS